MNHCALRHSRRISLREWLVWLSFFAEYNFEVKHKPGKQNSLADVLSRRPDYELAHVTALSSSVTDLIRAAYAKDERGVALLCALGSEEFKD